MQSSLILSIASSSSGDHPLIDVDGTVFLQLLLFGITWMVASKLLFKPYLKLRAAREAGIDGAKAEAVAFRAEAKSRVAAFEEKRNQAQARAQEERRLVKTETAVSLREIADDARAKSESALTDARSTLEKESSKTRDELMPKANDLAGQMVEKLLGRKLG